MAPTSLTMSLTLWLPLGMGGTEMAWMVSGDGAAGGQVSSGTRGRPLLLSSTSSAQELVAGFANLGLLRDFS